MTISRHLVFHVRVASLIDVRLPASALCLEIINPPRREAQRQLLLGNRLRRPAARPATLLHHHWLHAGDFGPAQSLDFAVRSDVGKS
jgi:hypothetical protein